MSSVGTGDRGLCLFLCLPRCVFNNGKVGKITPPATWNGMEWIAVSIAAWLCCSLVVDVHPLPPRAVPHRIRTTMTGTAMNQTLQRFFRSLIQRQTHPRIHQHPQSSFAECWSNGATSRTATAKKAAAKKAKPSQTKQKKVR